MRLTRICIVIGYLLACFTGLGATYIQRFETITTGGISYTGNTLGLSKQNNQNNAGTQHSIGAFSTLNLLSQVGTFPAGTTLTWQNNASSAVLDLPPGSTVLYAELVWSGSFGFGGQITGNEPNSSITFISPDAVSHSIAPDPTTSQQVITTGNQGFYTRSQNVTSIVAANGAGTYTAGGIAATVAASDNSNNSAGWTLAVVYSNNSMNTSELSLWVANELTRSQTQPNPEQLTGFCTPPMGSFDARLFASALEGDANLIGDGFLIGPSLPLSNPTDAISGTNNPINNFFSSQINTILNYVTDVNGKIIATGSGSIDTRGTFGTRNQNAITGTNISAGRQGYDVTSVDVSSHFVNNQTSAYLQTFTQGDTYVLNSVALQIQVGSPVIISTKLVNGGGSANVNINDIVTLTFTLTNNGTIDANNVVFKDILETGLSYVPGTFKIDNVLQPDPNLTTGVSLSDLTAMGPTTTLEFQVQVNALPSSGFVYNNASEVDYTFSPCVGNPISQTVLSGGITIVLPSVQLPVANPDTGLTVANVPLNQTTSVLANDTGVNILVTSYTAPTFGSVVMDTTATMDNGKYVYTPPLNFSGIDQFQYTITDAYNNQASTTVTITVLPQALPESYTTGENTVLDSTTSPAPSVLSNDLGTGLFISAYDAVSDEGGTVVMNTVTGTFVYTPPFNFLGIDSFNYTITDQAGNTSSTIVTIFVGLESAFIGELCGCEFINKTRYRLVATWLSAFFPDAVEYRIYLDGNVVEVMPATDPHVFIACTISRSTAARYEIASVNSVGVESPHIPITLLP